MLGHGADTHKHAALAVNAQGLFDPLGHLFQLRGTGTLIHLMDQHHILLAHAEHKIVLPIREQTLDQIQRRGLQTFIHRPYHKYAAVYLSRHMQLLGAHVNIADKNIVGNDVLHEGALIVLLFIIILSGVQSHRRHGTHGTANTIVSAGKHRIVEMTAPAGQRLKGLALQRHTFAIGLLDGFDILAPLLTDARQLAAGDNSALGVNNADRAVSGLLELQYYILKNSTGHGTPSCSLSKRRRVLCANCHAVAHIISS